MHREYLNDRCWSFRLLKLNLTTGTAQGIGNFVAETERNDDAINVVLSPHHRLYGYIEEGGIFMVLPQYNPASYGPCIFTVEPPKSMPTATAGVKHAS